MKLVIGDSLPLHKLQFVQIVFEKEKRCLRLGHAITLT